MRRGAFWETAMKYDDHGLTINFMSVLADTNYSRINRLVSSKNIKPLSTSSKRNARYDIKSAREILKDLVKDEKPINSNNKVHAFYNFKGGTGKTTLCYQVSVHLAFCGYNVLLIDTDQQGNTTSTLGYRDNMKYLTLYDGISQNLNYKDIIMPVFEGLDLIPGNFSLVHLEQILKEKTSREFVLERYLGPLKEKYDFIMFDCNPSVSFINRNILSFSNHLNIITETHPFSLGALPVVMSDTKAYFEDLRRDMPSVHIIPNKYEDRSSTSAEALSALIKHYSKYVVPDFAIRKSEDFLKSSRDQVPISFFCKSNSIAFEDISDLVKIVIGYSSESKKEC